MHHQCLLFCVDHIVQCDSDLQLTLDSDSLLSASDNSTFDLILVLLSQPFD